jgi:hypothetical protein
MHVPRIVCVCYSIVNIAKCKQQVTKLLLHMITITFWKFNEYGDWQVTVTVLWHIYTAKNTDVFIRYGNLWHIYTAKNTDVFICYRFLLHFCSIADTNISLCTYILYIFDTHIYSWYIYLSMSIFCITRNMGHFAPALVVSG